MVPAFPTATQVLLVAHDTPHRASDVPEFCGLHAADATDGAISESAPATATTAPIMRRRERPKRRPCRAVLGVPVRAILMMSCLPSFGSVPDVGGSSRGACPSPPPVLLVPRTARPPAVRRGSS